jgi:hypothetical protein
VFADVRRFVGRQKVQAALDGTHYHLMQGMKVNFGGEAP